MKPVVVFFNASVVLAALHSPKGGSAKLIRYCQQKKITGIISEVVLDEIRRNLVKINITQFRVKRTILSFKHIEPAPANLLVEKYQRLVIDPGDGHILASSEEAKAKYLVSLDKHHILILAPKITKFKIVNPKQLINKIES
ncbi:putative toxin-antitoxin system toxin component, PIN family [Candidatus Beckwithbacteria bacterium CG2_30_44_31]|uniref:Putative toxin-antitoxin system toxin component, PIN family n=1 Tax=Candidatus Beckwithbacteria bacterium CG2_30_44_31 TaxID=1805035 RepID=A0A1J5AWB3_9BACT|nr:MAG: putative toxin-antitoxin system toxin component, PIN family [Candidatus Beckwithbacteria bacterium CG2_30_44_31]